jgi:hypothetical protein
MSKKLLIFVFVLLPLMFQLCVAQEINNADSDETLPDAPLPQRSGPELWKIEHHPVPASRIVPSVDLPPLEGLRAELTLMSAVSSKLPSGSVLRARLEQPVVKDGQTVLPAGTLFEGHVETSRARRMMRPGSLALIFDHLLLPSDTNPIRADVISIDSKSVRVDVEGRIHPTLSKRRLAIQLGSSFLVGKVADDLAEVAGGTAVGAGTARFIGMGTAAAFLMVQKGREVRLRQGDKIEIELGRTRPVLPNSIDKSPLLPNSMGRTQ